MSGILGRGLPVLLASGRNEQTLNEEKRPTEGSVEDVARQFRERLTAEGHESYLSHLYFSSENGAAIFNGYAPTDPRQKRIELEHLLTLEDQKMIISHLKLKRGLVDEHVLITHKNHGFVMRDKFDLRTAQIKTEIEKELSFMGLLDHMEVIRKGPEIHVYPNGVNKLRALDFIKDRYHLTDNDVATFGDKGKPGELDHGILDKVGGFSTDTYDPESRHMVALRVLSGFLPGYQSFLWALDKLHFEPSKAWESGESLQSPPASRPLLGMSLIPVIATTFGLGRTVATGHKFLPHFSLTLPITGLFGAMPSFWGVGVAVVPVVTIAVTLAFFIFIFEIEKDFSSDLPLIFRVILSITGSVFFAGMLGLSSALILWSMYGILLLLFHGLSVLPSWAQYAAIIATVSVGLWKPFRIVIGIVRQSFGLRRPVFNGDPTRTAGLWKIQYWVRQILDVLHGLNSLARLTFASRRWPAKLRAFDTVMELSNRDPLLLTKYLEYVNDLYRQLKSAGAFERLRSNNINNYARTEQRNIQHSLFTLWSGDQSIGSSDLRRWLIEINELAKQGMDFVVLYQPAVMSCQIGELSNNYSEYLLQQLSVMFEARPKASGPGQNKNGSADIKLASAA